MGDAEIPSRPFEPKKVEISVTPGKPLQIDLPTGAQVGTASNTFTAALGKTFKAYRDAADALLRGKYARAVEFVPPTLREPRNITIFHCDDGILVRYDRLLEGKPTVKTLKTTAKLRDLAPAMSENVIHFPEDPEHFTPGEAGPRIALARTSPSGAVEDLAMFRILVVGSTRAPGPASLTLPPARPIPLVSMTNEIQVQVHGHTRPADPAIKVKPEDIDYFISQARLKLPFGWEGIEIYPPLGIEYWKPECAPLWAEMDILAAIAQRNLGDAELRALDPRAETRRGFALLLDQFQGLLSGLEEPVHQFLKAHPELIGPTADRIWSKVRFGERISDFVLREPYNDYELVEIEAPIRELFRKDGQQREELTHAIDQISDWIRYIEDNRKKVEEELGLTGISTSPRALVVIGRSASLTEENRRKLTTLQNQSGKLRILTYDDLLAGARANLERILGPLTLTSSNARIYFFKDPAPPSKSNP